MQRSKLANLAYLIGTTGFLAAWCIAAAGLAALQSSCSHNEAGFASAVGAGGLLAPSVGSNCRKLFRFPWFVLALGFLPVLLDFAGVAARGRKAGLHLYAAAVPLYIIVANMLHNLVEVSPYSSTTKLRIRVALAGFAITAAMALLQMVSGAMMGDTPTDRVSHHDEIQSVTTTGAAYPKQHHVVVDHAGHHGPTPAHLVPSTVNVPNTTAGAHYNV